MATQSITITWTAANAADLVTQLNGFCRNVGYPGSYSDNVAMKAFLKAAIIQYVNDCSTAGQKQLIQDLDVFPPATLPPAT